MLLLLTFGVRAEPEAGGWLAHAERVPGPGARPEGEVHEEDRHLPPEVRVHPQDLAQTEVQGYHLVVWKRIS